MHVKRAPEPSDVLWENLQYSKYEQAVRQTASTLTMCVIAAAGIFGIFSSNFYIAPGVNPTVSISSTIQYLGQVRKDVQDCGLVALAFTVTNLLANMWHVPVSRDSP